MRSDLKRQTKDEYLSLSFRRLTAGPEQTMLSGDWALAPMDPHRHPLTGSFRGSSPQPSPAGPGHAAGGDAGDGGGAGDGGEGEPPNPFARLYAAGGHADGKRLLNARRAARLGMTTADASDAAMLLNAAQATLMGETVECQRCRIESDAAGCQCQCWSHLFATSRGPLPGFLGPGGGGFGQALGESTPVVAQDQRTLEAEQNKVSRSSETHAPMATTR